MEQQIPNGAENSKFWNDATSFQEVHQSLRAPRRIREHWLGTRKSIFNLDRERDRTGRVWTIERKIHFCSGIYLGSKSILMKKS